MNLMRALTFALITGIPMAALAMAYEKDSPSDSPFINPFVVDGETIVFPLQAGFWTMEKGGATSENPKGECIPKEKFDQFINVFVRELEVRDCRFVRKQWKNGTIDLDMTCTDKNGTTAMKLNGNYSPTHVSISAQEISTLRGSEKPFMIDMKRLRDCKPDDAMMALD